MFKKTVENSKYVIGSVVFVPLIVSGGLITIPSALIIQGLGKVHGLSVLGESGRVVRYGNSISPTTLLENQVAISGMLPWCSLLGPFAIIPSALTVVGASIGVVTQPFGI